MGRPRSQPDHYVEAAATDVWQKVVKPRLSEKAIPGRDFVWVHQVPAHGPVDEEEGTSLWPEYLTRVTLSWQGDVAPTQRPCWETDIDRTVIEHMIGEK